MLISISRIPLGLSEAWLAESTARLQPIYPEAARLLAAPALRDLAVIIVGAKRLSGWPSGSRHFSS